MENIIFLIAVVSVLVISGVAITIFYLKKTIKQLTEGKKDEFALGLIKQDIEAMRKKFEDGYGQMAQQLGRVQEIGHAMRDFQDFLKSPKLRGNIGEQVLKGLLEQFLPKRNFKTQYQFQEGQIVDAIIET